jgi:hypothetical protein
MIKGNVRVSYNLYGSLRA